MIKLKSLIKYIPFLLLTIVFTSCGDDDETQEEVDVFAGCCSEEPVYGANVNNLDESNGEIIVYNLFTPNYDAINDAFGIVNIENYDNHTVTIYDIDDNIVFESSNYVGFGNLFPDGEQGQFGSENYSDGTYKYKIVIENEDVFRKSGTFCLFGDFSALDEQNFSDCTIGSQFDPALTGN
ncbi:gliding motility-associated C-terminal domain-containing protein [Winogradskyella sp. ECml5-4]|uniref:T9SS type B sorting domain-containing protein n=1 Tax=Winogradskyella sp. ECml5-4 TaxID=3110975 RepID=UPI002FF1118D